jgi:hypothetical protein
MDDLRLPVSQQLQGPSMMANLHRNMLSYRGIIIPVSFCLQAKAAKN